MLTYKMSVQEIEEQLDKLSQIAKERMSDSTILIGHYCEIDFLTKEEKETRHQLILGLPTFAEEREAARLRIKERISKRNPLHTTHQKLYNRTQEERK